MPVRNMATWQTNKAVFNLKAIDNQQDFYKNEKMKVYTKLATISVLIKKEILQVPHQLFNVFCFFDLPVQLRTIRKTLT